MVHLKYLSLAVLQHMDLIPSSSQTYAVPMIPLGSRCILMPHLVQFLSLYKNKGGDLINPIWRNVETNSSFGMPGFCGKTLLKLRSPPSLQSSLPKPSLISYFPLKYLHSLVIQQMHELRAVGHVRFYKLRLPEPSSCCFRLLKERAHMELSLIKMTGPILIWMIFTCEGFPKLVKPSFLLVNYL